MIYSAESQQQRPVTKDCLKQILDLQEKYTALDSECRRFADWVLNYSRDCRAIAIQFDNEYLNLAGREIYSHLRPKIAEEKESERKAFNDKDEKDI